MPGFARAPGMLHPAGRARSCGSGPAAAAPRATGPGAPKHVPIPSYPPAHSAATPTSPFYARRRWPGQARASASPAGSSPAAGGGNVEVRAPARGPGQERGAARGENGGWMGEQRPLSTGEEAGAWPSQGKRLLGVVCGTSVWVQGCGVPAGSHPVPSSRRGCRERCLQELPLGHPCACLHRCLLEGRAGSWHWDLLFLPLPAAGSPQGGAVRASCCPPAAQRLCFALLRCLCKDTFVAWGARGCPAALLRLWGCILGCRGCSQQVQQGQA